jgi:hypothetical protein
MRGTRQEPDTIATTLAATAPDIRRAVRVVDPHQVTGLAQLRDTGWQLTQLTGELADLITLLAEHTGHHTEHAEQVRHADGEPAIEHLARACRELATLRHALDTAHTAARDYYTAISHLGPTRSPDPPRRSP